MATTNYPHLPTIGQPPMDHGIQDAGQPVSLWGPEREVPPEYGGPLVPSGRQARKTLQARADEILKAADGAAPPTEVEPERIGYGRRRVWSADALLDAGLEPGAVRLTRAGLRLRADDDPEEFGTEGLDDLLDLYGPGLTPLERRVAFMALDGREPDQGYMTDVADALGISSNSARVHWSNARRKIREHKQAQAS